MMDIEGIVVLLCCGITYAAAGESNETSSCGGFTGTTCETITQVDVWDISFQTQLKHWFVAVLVGAVIGAQREFRNESLKIFRRLGLLPSEKRGTRSSHWVRETLDSQNKGGAGLRTHILVCLGACIFTTESQHGFAVDIPISLSSGGDPARIATAIVTGVGFLGGGAIIKSGNKSSGLTTAASIWLAASLGMVTASVNESLTSTIAAAGVIVAVLQFFTVVEEWLHFWSAMNQSQDVDLTLSLRVPLADVLTYETRAIEIAHQCGEVNTTTVRVKACKAAAGAAKQIVILSLGYNMSIAAARSCKEASPVDRFLSLASSTFAGQLVKVDVGPTDIPLLCTKTAKTELGIKSTGTPLALSMDSTKQDV